MTRSPKSLWPPSLREELARVETELTQLRARAEGQENELRDAREECQRLRSSLQQTEERFALTVRGAKDGLWEWDLTSGKALFSARWKAMLGYTDEEFPDHRDAWLAHVHPADRPLVEADLRAHLEGDSPNFERELRLRHKDGRFRWMLSRGAALRRASGKPYRMVGLDTDITRVKRVESIVEQIAAGTAGAQGEAFFRALVRHFAGALDVSCAFITECVNRPTTRVRTLAYWNAEDYRDNIEFDLAGTPCEEVIHCGETRFYPTGVGHHFPRDAAYDSYIGVPIFGSDNEVIGHLAFFDTRQMTPDVLVEPIFRIFCARAGAELERRFALDQLADRR
ncbi:MAG: PAS domain-containing protein [Zoogloeaceae bacterium]|nr:PAS domain-containing protein [Zoogloeaceae bacterium]